MKLCADQYANYSARFAAIDTKAQGTAAIAGVLLGATLAFVPQALFRAVVGYYGPTGVSPILAAVALAIAGILFATHALHVKPARIPFRGEIVAQETKNLLCLSDSDLTDEFIERHYGSQLTEWQLTLGEMASIINDKSRALRRSQLSVAGSAASVAVFVCVVVLAAI
jgi:hypothetical protein